MTDTAKISQEENAEAPEVQQDVIDGPPASLGAPEHTGYQPIQGQALKAGNNTALAQTTSSDVLPSYTKIDEYGCVQQLKPQERAKMDYERIMGEQQGYVASQSALDAQLTASKGIALEQYAQINGEHRLVQDYAKEVDANILMPWYNLKDNPGRIRCPFCRVAVLTVTKQSIGNTIMGTACCLFWCAGGILAWIPFVIPTLQDREHHCPNCNRMICTMTAGGHFIAAPGLRVPKTKPVHS